MNVVGKVETPELTTTTETKSEVSEEDLGTTPAGTGETDSSVISQEGDQERVESDIAGEFGKYGADAGTEQNQAVRNRQVADSLIEKGLTSD